MIKREASAAVVFRHWIKANPMFSCTLEMKQTTTDSISFSCVEQAQLDWGMAIRSDKGALVRVQGTSGEPDYIWCRNMPSYIVIKYPKIFCIIPVPVFLLEKERSTRRSLTVARAIEIATTTVRL